MRKYAALVWGGDAPANSTKSAGEMQLSSITKNDEKELYHPKVFNTITRRRFVRDRRHRLHTAIGGEPTDGAKPEAKREPERPRG
jgi:hypothetical protein